jgi:benzoylformate decarboxylase
VLLLGGNLFRTLLYSAGLPLPEGVEVLHLSGDPLQLGRTYPTKLGVLGDPAATLRAMLPYLQIRADKSEAERAIRRAEAYRADESRARAAEVAARLDSWPPAPVVAAHALVQALPTDAFIVDARPTLPPARSARPRRRRP